jgi:hypothetical protein
MRDDDDEDAVALAAVEAWLDVEGDDELAQASREALVAIAQEALAMKVARERQEAAARRDEARRERERRAERERAEARERSARWEAERKARDARLAAVERAQARALGEKRRVEPAPTGRQKEVRRAWEQPVVPARRVEAPPTVIAEDEPDDHDVDEAEQADDAAEVGWEPLEASPADDVPEEPDRFLCAQGRPVLTGADLAAWRARHELTQQAAADRLGVRQGTVSKAESRGAGALGPALCEALAGVLAVEGGAA